MKSCKRLGCGQMYEEIGNSELGCIHHPGWPVFRDINKTWTCCGKSNMDWDEFLKIPGCANGSHSDIKPTRPMPRNIDDSKITPVPIPKLSVCSFNNVEAEGKKAEEAARPQKPWRSDSGLFRCRHAGCQMLYDPSSNWEDSCEYHPGAATFKDTRKYWPCCEAGSYDWDEFMKIPKCQRGQHEPKMVDA